jgi:hypothetical protein
MLAENRARDEATQPFVAMQCLGVAPVNVIRLGGGGCFATGMAQPGGARLQRPDASLTYFRNWFSVSCRRATKETQAFQCARSCTGTMTMV